MRLHRGYESEDQKVLDKMHARGVSAVWEDREEFIKGYAPGISGQSLHKLAITSRGLNQVDLQRAVDKYLESVEVPVPDHPTNTCRLNGYWLERLMDPYEVARKLAKWGFRAEISRTFWGPGRSSPAKKLVKHGLNLLSRLSKAMSLRVSLYYGVRGIK